MNDWTTTATAAERLHVEEEMAPFRLTDEPAPWRPPARPTCQKAMVALGWRHEPRDDWWIKITPTGVVRLQDREAQAHYGRGVGEFVQWLATAGQPVPADLIRE